MALLLLAPVVRAAEEAGAAIDRPRHVHEAAAYVKERGGPPAHTRSSAHFALHWGDQQPAGAVLDDAFADQALQWLEELWKIYLVQNHFPAPRHDCKLNAYITGTGLKPFLGGYAFGFGDPEGHGTLIGDWTIFKPGHNGAAHEFVHALQAESGGFRDSQYVGWFWETHAQFLSHQATGRSDLPHVLERYAQTAQWDVASTRHHYGSWIFFQYIAERLPDGMGLVNRLWTEPPADPDEDAIAKLRRLMPATGDRERAWADLVGDYAKRNVGWGSYRMGPDYRAALRMFDNQDRRGYFTWLAPSPSRPGWWRVPRFFAPQQEGYNVIPMRLRAGAAGDAQVKVELAGFADAALRSAWRATLIAVDAKDGERYSPTWAAGAQEFSVRADEKLYLVVAAAPGVHHPPPFKDLYQTIPYHPYEIRCEGAEPRSLGMRIRPVPAGAKGHAHANGGGFVADSATVATTAFVGKDAAVIGRGRVSGTARIEDFATIEDAAEVGDKAVVGGDALVSGHAHVGDEALVTDFAEVRDQAQIGGRARVFGTARVVGSTSVQEGAVVKGHCTTTSVKLIHGCAVVDGDVEWDFAADDLATGIFFGTLLDPEAARKQPDSRSLYARWPLDQPHSWKLADAFGSNDGVLQGGAAVAADPVRRSALALAGNGQFADLPRDVALHRQLTLAAWVKLESDRGDQGVFAFVDASGKQSVELVAADEHGVCALRATIGGASLSVRGVKPPLHRWFHLAATLGDGGIALYVDGKPAGSREGAIHPDDARPSSAFLGRCAVAGFLAGHLSDARIWTRALAAAEVIDLAH